MFITDSHLAVLAIYKADVDPRLLFMDIQRKNDISFIWEGNLDSFFSSSLLPLHPLSFSFLLYVQVMSEHSSGR